MSMSYGEQLEQIRLAMEAGFITKAEAKRQAAMLKGQTESAPTAAAKPEPEPVGTLIAVVSAYTPKDSPGSRKYKGSIRRKGVKGHPTISVFGGNETETEAVVQAIAKHYEKVSAAWIE
jgi:hypothetical protein